jgi:hypothetical protein
VSDTRSKSSRSGIMSVDFLLQRMWGISAKGFLCISLFQNLSHVSDFVFEILSKNFFGHVLQFFFCFLSRLGVIKILETYFEPKTLPDLILFIL